LSEERVERRLAAILAADVVGYSRLMGQDEAGTLRRLRDHRRELIAPEIAEHKGRMVKTTGDGLRVEFAAQNALGRHHGPHNPVLLLECSTAHWLRVRIGLSRRENNVQDCSL
jgi:class 3 adenylate cyclase